jgi:hypothetical protein
MNKNSTVTSVICKDHHNAYVLSVLKLKNCSTDHDYCSIKILGAKTVQKAWLNCTTRVIITFSMLTDIWCHDA